MQPSEIVVEFSETSQSLEPLREAAYRFISVGSCIIDHADGRYLCRLTRKNSDTSPDDVFRQRFIDIVTDENLRAKLDKETRPLRDVIVSLAFGAWAASPQRPET